MRSANSVVIFVFTAILFSWPSPVVGDDRDIKHNVVLLHGLARSASSMDDMEQSLQQAGYRVCNIEYPSRKHAVAELAREFVAPRIDDCVPDSGQAINFVTHSLGGIIVRELADDGLVREIGRVVMLGPPNQGSEVVDALSDWYLFKVINGPAGGELGTSESSVPVRLGPANFEVGVIAGSKTINWINSLIIPGEDDGKVSVEHAKLEGMKDFVVVDVTHPFMMVDNEVINQALRFLSSGCFEHEEQESSMSGEHSCVPEEAPAASTSGN